jgi:cytoskeletal protein CcmA (bactofilin family)
MAESAKDGAVVGEEASLSGKFKGQDLVVLGRLDGDLELRGRLRVGPKGSVHATVRAAAIEVEGEVEGELRSDALSLLPTARVRGTFVAKRLSVQEGAVVEGSINPASARAPEPAPAPAPPPTPPSAAAPAPAAGAAPPSEPKPEYEPPK